jgi:hypothetical protein
LSVARQVLLALCEAHALGITHRDIKPDNIFLASVRGADVVAKVMDFGIAGLAQAQRKSRLTGTGVIIGTPMYMSPEQAQGLPVDGKSDLYSLGVVLFEMLTGRPVFESNTAVTLLLAHVARAPMRLDEAGVQLREQVNLQALLDRLLSKDPAERPSAAEALDSVTTLAARLGIAGATGSMRAVAPLPAARAVDDERSQPLAAPAFQGVRVTGHHTHSPLRPAAIVLGASLVLTAATALALRWVPALIEATQPTAAAPVQPAAKPAEPARRSVMIDSQPSGAYVLLDGEKIGSTPYALQLQHDTEISVAHEGYARQLVSVAHDARSPVLVKLLPLEEAKPKLGATVAEKSTPFFFSFKQENSARIEPRAQPLPERRRVQQAPARVELPAFEPSVLVTRDPEELRAAAPLSAADARATARDDARERDHASSQQVGQSARGRDSQRADAPSAGSARDDESSYARDQHGDSANARDGELAETSRSAATRIEAVREDELAEIALDDDERARVAKHYGLRAFGRAVARAMGRLLIPYPDRARRAALAEMPLTYFSFREARTAYKNAELDGTGFQEAVWQLRERRRRQITVERDRYARGELSQGQYEARLDRIWEQFWGRR